MKLKIKSIVLAISTAVIFNFAVFNLPMQADTQAEQNVYTSVQSPLDIVGNPAQFLNKKVKINAVFDKFSLLGLDYKPAFRSSEKYISFLIRRPDLTGTNIIPLSELKLLISRDIAEKQLIDVESGDKIEFTGQIFSTALNDPWIEVDNVKILTVKKKQTANNSNNKKKPVKTNGSKRQ